MKSNSFSEVIAFIWLTVAVAAVTLATLVSGEFFSSVHELTKLVDYEQYLLGKMEKFITLNEMKLDYLKKKLSLFEKNQADDSEEPITEYFKNHPINMYLMVKRLSQDWEKLRKSMDYEIGSSILTKIDKFKNNYTPSGDHDYHGAIEGILRLQHVYRLSTKDVAKGILGGIKYNITSELSANDCFDFGNVALKTRNLLQAHAWLSEALHRSRSQSYQYIKSTLMDDKFQISDVLELLAAIKFELGDFRGAAEISQELKILFPNDTKILELQKNYTQHQLSWISKDVTDEHEPIPPNLDKINPITLESDLAYRLTCSGHINPLPSQQRYLACGYLSETHPFLLLAPLKVEELHWDPLVVLYHDVIYDSEIEKLIQLASDKMSRATVFSGNDSLVSNHRTSQFVFLDKRKRTSYRILKIIDERTTDMTGLNMETSEKHQLANYGIGGHYSYHYDFFASEISKKGNRIATVLFYLSDVEQGGGTAFPLLRRLVKPQKGAAVFWYNLHTSGDGDRRSQHGACPVLVGSKWVLNRWIHERGQEFRRPCSLVSDAKPYSVMF